MLARRLDMDHVAALAGRPARVVEALPDDVVASRLARRPRRRVHDVLDLPAVAPPPDIVRIDPAPLAAEQPESPDQTALRVGSLARDLRGAGIVGIPLWAPSPPGT